MQNFILQDNERAIFWNTGRGYTEAGQRIYAIAYITGDERFRVLFMDIDRGLDYVFEVDGYLDDMNKDQLAALILRRYDGGGLNYPDLDEAPRLREFVKAHQAPEVELEFGRLHASPVTELKQEPAKPDLVAGQPAATLSGGGSTSASGRKSARVAFNISGKGSLS